MIIRRRWAAMSFMFCAFAVAFLTALPWTPPARPERDLGLAVSRRAHGAVVRSCFADRATSLNDASSFGDPIALPEPDGLQAPILFIRALPALAHRSSTSPQLAGPSSRAPPAV